MADIDRLAQALFGGRRAESQEVSTDATTRTYIGIATTDSEDGTAYVSLEGDVTLPDDVIDPEGTVIEAYEDNGIEMSVGPSIHEGDEVIVTLVGGGPLKTPMVTSVAGEGDRQDAAIDEAARAAEVAWEWADEAHEAAVDAQQSADDAATSAAEARTSAEQANTAANSALTQLSVVEDVAGTLQWISDHGSFVATTDTTVQEGTVYFVLDGEDYVPVAEPTGNPFEQGWYVLDVSESQSDYIMSHIAVTSRGLWVLPNGIGSAPDEQHAAGYKLLLASDGSYLYDGDGQLVTTNGESIVFSSSRPQYIGGEDAYIVYYDSDGDGRPDSISIGGSKVTIGGASMEDLTNTVVYDHTYSTTPTGYAFSATLTRGGTDITADVDPERFVWWLRTEGSDTLWARGPTMTIPMSQAGYRATIIGGFEELSIWDIVDDADNYIVDAEGNGIQAYDILIGW